MKDCRPAEGDIVLVLNTGHAKKHCPELIDTMVAISSTDEQSTAPYQVVGSDVAWFGESMLQFVRTAMEARVRFWDSYWMFTSHWRYAVSSYKNKRRVCEVFVVLWERERGRSCVTITIVSG